MVLLSKLRKCIRFFLAGLLWLHALFVFRLPSPNLPRVAGSLHMTTSEALVFGLLVAFSVLAAYGYGRVIGDLFYIYFFPFVLIYLGCKWLYRGLVSVNRFCAAGIPRDQLIVLPTVKVVNAPPTDNAKAETAKKGIGFAEIRSALTRPFRQFTLLWCFLLLFTTHTRLLQLALGIVVIHIVYILVAILRLTLGFGGVLTRLETYIRTTTETLLAKVAFVTRESAANDDLRNTWTRISGIKMGLMLLRNKQLVSRWAAVLGTMFLGCMYAYVAFLFSFVYYGAAHLQSIPFAWPSALVDSAFIPFAFSDLPANVWLKLIGGVHGMVILAVTAGTILNYFTRRAEDLQKVAIVLSDRFANEDVQERLSIVEEKFKAAETATKPGISEPTAGASHPLVNQGQ